jgi:hypothetical protein
MDVVECPVLLVPDTRKKKMAAKKKTAAKEKTEN